jgi:7-dehydrocholesterol reductase
MVVSAILQLAYISKFFWWEAGYLNTIDIMLDRAGYYICWGCLVYVPSLYASVSLYLVNNPVRLGWFWTIVILSCGLLAISVNYFADWQKQRVRSADGDAIDESVKFIAFQSINIHENCPNHHPKSTVCEHFDIKSKYTRI